MSIYSQAESGTSFLKSRFSKSISNRMIYDCRFHELIPVLKRFVLPGDVWRIGGNALVRFQPMSAPTMTANSFRVRYFFVPLRQIEENAELIITGSKNGKLYTDTLPTFDNFVKNADKTSYPNCFKVTKYSFWDYMNVQLGDYENIKDSECLPAEYWYKAYCKIWFDFYRDENIEAQSDFDTWYADIQEAGADRGPFFSNISKDYFMSCLPWQLKGTAPRINVTGEGQITINNANLFTWYKDDTYPTWNEKNVIEQYQVEDSHLKTPELSVNPGGLGSSEAAELIDGANKVANDWFSAKLGDGDIDITALGFDSADLRTMMAQTRIFERLARCGSRYTEYLRSNFGVAPADETLQRPKYLGGWKLPIVTTEVLQTAEGSDGAVGTMYGHGISRGGNNIETFYAKEFGVLFGLAEVRPQVQYTTGINRQLTYKRRFDFFNPSFQHLSEQEVRNGELYINFTPDADTGLYDNDDTFGFQAYGNELRSSQDEIVADMRDGLSYWNQGLHFNQRPNLDSAVMYGFNHLGSFNAPFVYRSTEARPILVDFYNILDVYRPMVRYATPGLVDHL